MDELILESHAKINIGLDILKKRDDGYHEIRSIFQELGWGDIIRIKRRSNGIVFSCNVPELETDSNLCILAAQKILADTGFGIEIELDKRIPTGAGLGGGSSNAAAVLKGINRLYNLNYTNESLVEMGAQLGSDIPFFIYGKTAHVSGRGEIIEPITNKCPLDKVLLVLPEVFLSTKRMYSMVKKILTKEKKSLILYGSFAERILQSQITGLKNDFEEIAMHIHPELRNIKEILLKSGCPIAMMTGSGSAFYGLSETDMTPENELKDYRVIQTHIIR